MGDLVAEVFKGRDLKVSVWTVKFAQMPVVTGDVGLALERAIVGAGDLWASLEPWDRASEFVERWRWGGTGLGEGSVVVPLGQGGGPLLAVRVRQHKSPDGRLLKARVNEAMADEIANWSGPRNKQGKPKVSKLDRAIIAKEAGRMLVREAQARVTVHAVVWCPEEQLLLVFGGGSKVRGAVAEAMRQILAQVYKSQVFIEAVGLDAATRRWRQIGAGAEDFYGSWMRWLAQRLHPLAPTGEGPDRLEARQGDMRVRLHHLEGFGYKTASGEKMEVEGREMVRTQLGEVLSLKGVGTLTFDVAVRDELAHRPETWTFGLRMDGRGWPAAVRGPKSFMVGLGLVIERAHQIKLLVKGVEVLLAAWWLAEGRTVAAQGSVFQEDPAVVTLGEPGGGW